MAASSTWTSLKLSLGAAGLTEAALAAMDYVADACLREPQAQAGNTARDRAELDSTAAGGHARNQETAPAKAGGVPEGFVPLPEARHLALLGRWPLLEDGMPACLPMKTLLAMRFRLENGDRDADAWLKLYARAYAGDPEAQRLFGRACENGSYRTPADRQRAYFWYHRAALQNDIEAGFAVERLRHTTRILPAVTAPPSLVYPGLWRITTRTGTHAGVQSLFELAEDGTASGSRIGGGGVAAEIIGNALKPFAAPYSQSLFLPVVQEVGFEGRWAYYDSRTILALDVAASAAGMPAARSERWYMELIACRIGAVFGRNPNGSTYILEYSPPAKNP